MAGLSGKEAKEAVNQSLEIKRLQKQVAELKADQVKHCITCQSLERHDCFTLHRCPMLGYVDPYRDGCTKHKERRTNHEVKIID